MQCESCSGQATVRVTEVRGGKPVDRHMCKQHAAEMMGVSGPANWEAFFRWAVAYFKSRGTLPDVLEIAQQGKVGAHVATLCKACPDAGREQLRRVVEKRLVA